MHKRSHSHLPTVRDFGRVSSGDVAGEQPEAQSSEPQAGMPVNRKPTASAGVSQEGSAFPTFARSSRAARNPLRTFRGVAQQGRSSRGWGACHPDSFFWWFFLLGVSLWVLLVLVVQFKTRDAYFVKGTSGADVAGTEVTINLPIFETGSQLEGVEDDNDERYTFYNISDFNPVEVALSENELPLEDDDFQMPVETKDPNDSIFNLMPIGGSFSHGAHHISVVGPQGVHVTVQSNEKPKGGSAPVVKHGIVFGDLGQPLSLEKAGHGKEQAANAATGGAKQITIKRVPRSGNKEEASELPASPRDASLDLRIAEAQVPMETLPESIFGGVVPEAGAAGSDQGSAALEIEELPHEGGSDPEEETAPVAESHPLTAQPSAAPAPVITSQAQDSNATSEWSGNQTAAAFNMTADFAWAYKLGKERQVNRKVTHVTDDAFIYGRVWRWSARSDLTDRIKMVPKPEAASKRPTEFREGCPAAAQPLRLVPEFSNYIFKHYAAARAGSSLRYVHMGTLAPMPYGGLVSAFQASHFTEGAEDQRIFLSYSKDGDIGQKWTEPIRLPVHARGAQWGPVLHVHPKTGNVWLFYTESSDKTCLRPGSSKYPPRFAPGGDVMVTKTRDGKTWAAPHRIYSMAEEGGAPKVIANSIHVTSKGTWMLPFWRESHYFNLQTPCHTNTTASHGVLISRDDGRTWEPRGAIEMDKSHVYEGSIAELGDGSAVMVFRTQMGAAAMSRSTDEGETWSEPYLIAADNPDSKPNLVNIWPNGEVLMAYNDHTKENIACRNCRSKLSISRLVNSTASWDHVAQFGPSPSDYLKVHYPTMIQHGCRLFAIYSSMYACCAPFGAHQCECAPEGAEVGLLVVSFKIWEDGKDAEEQMANYTMRGKVRQPEAIRPWENHWWNDFQDSSVFDSLLKSKQEENQRAKQAAKFHNPFGLETKDQDRPMPGSPGVPRKVQFGYKSLETVVAELAAKEAQAASGSPSQAEKQLQ